MTAAKAIITTQSKKTTDINAELKNAHEYINSIDFSMVMNELINKYKWLRNEAEEACFHYRRFLYLIKKYGSIYNLVPSTAIDEVWHRHIYIDTRKYMEDCQIIFGKYNHHRRTEDNNQESSELEANFTLTKKLYLKEFGEPLMTTHYFLKPLLRWLTERNTNKP